MEESFRPDWVYQRDASWYARPNVRAPKRYHRPTDDGMAACRPRSIVLAGFTGSPRPDVDDRLICHRPACTTTSDSPPESTTSQADR